MTERVPPADYVLRPMTAGDVDAVCAIETQVFAMPWSRQSFLQEVNENKAARYLVLERGGRVLAYGGMWLVIDEAHVTNIAVDPKARGRGYGGAITRALVDMARGFGLTLITLEVRRSNLAAQALYHKVGFLDVGYRKRYYEDNQEDALIMYCQLNQGPVEDRA